MNSISHLFHLFILLSYLKYLILYAWRYHWPTHMELPNTHAHKYRAWWWYTRTRTHKNKKHTKKRSRRCNDNRQTTVTHHTGSRINFWTFSQTHISTSELMNGHISRFCSVVQVIQVISSAKFFSVEEVDLSFNSWIWIHESDFKGFILEKRPWKSFSIKCSNLGINESTPQTQSNVIWISSKTELEISFLNSLLEKWVWEHGSKPLTQNKISEISQWQKCFSELKISNPRISCTVNGVRRSSWKVVWVVKWSYATETSVRWQILCSCSWQAIDTC